MYLPQRAFGARLPQALDYARLLAGDGVDHGLIGPREVDRLWTRHLLPSAALTVLLPRGSSVADVGSGAGLPGLVLALVRPDVRVTLVEPMARRCAFLERAVADVGLTAQVSVRRARGEDLAVENPAFDVVVARAVARLPRLLEILLPLCRAGGQVLAVKGAGLGEEVAEASAVLRGPRVRWWDTVELVGAPATAVAEAVPSGSSPGPADVVRVFRAVAADNVVPRRSPHAGRRGGPGTRRRA